MNDSSISNSSVATRVRYGVVVFTLLLAMITYLDRACISKLAPLIMSDLELSEQQMSWVFSAFAIAYAAFEIPTAWYADRLGTRRVLARIVFWWSSFTILSAAAWNFSSLITIRFLFGAGEAGAWPGVARTFSRWIPRSERGTIQGIFFAAAHLAGGLTPIVVTFLLGYVSWKMVFVLFGLIGVIWAVAWTIWFRDEPAEHRSVNAAERDMIERDRDSSSGHHEGWDYWRRLFGHRNMLPLCLMYIPNSFAFYFCITWLPTYLKERHGFEDAWQLSFFAGLPLLLSIVGDLFGGVTTDSITRRFGLRIGRSGVGAGAYFIAGVAMLLAATLSQPILAASFIAIAVASSMFILGAAWGTCLDIGGSHAGVVSAAMNTAGQIGSISCPLLVTHLHQKYNWDVPVLVMGVLFLVGAISWIFIDPTKRVFE